MTAPFDSPRYRATRELFQRAAAVIPGGIYGHAAPASLVPGALPYFAARAKGCRYWDVDGNEFIDFMCGYGPIVLGYNDPVVDEAAERQRREGNCFNHPTERMVELAELLVQRVEFADWAVFGKNGSDMTTWATQVAREVTGRKKIVKIKGAYHGIDPWCTPGHGGLIPEDTQHIHTFAWNDLDGFERLLRRYPDQIAGLILTPYHHPVFADQVMPAHGFLPGLEELCRKRGIVLILDDIRAGFRLHPGGSHCVFGFTPDLICFCKALANGYALSACLGRRELRKSANAVFLTGSYWNSAVPMAAALACLAEMERVDAIAKIFNAGERLWIGLENAAAKHGYSVRLSGPPALPYMTFKNDPDFRLMQRFCAEAALEGVFYHPHHNWFVSVAHSEMDIDAAVERSDKAFARMAAETCG